MDREELINIFEKLKNTPEIRSYSEADIEQAAIFPILKSLGWDTDNPLEVKRQYPVDKKSDQTKVDFAIRHDNKCKAYIEAKKPFEELEKHAIQLHDYCYKCGSPAPELAILTNGIKWWFYLPQKLIYKPSWDERKFYAFDINNENNFEIVSEKTVSILSKENVISDKYVENAENIYNSQNNYSIVKNTAFEILEELIKKPDNLLVELIADKVEEKCGYRDNRAVKDLLNEISIYSNKVKLTSTYLPLKKEKVILNKDFTNLFQESWISKNWTGFPRKGKLIIEFLGEKEKVEGFKSLYLKFLEIICKKNKDFTKLLELSTENRPYFSWDENGFNPRDARTEIPYTNFYCNTQFSNEDKKNLILEILNKFEYKENDLNFYAVEF